MCANGEKRDSEKCNEQQCTEWRFGQWSQCSVSCGHGVQRREARCVNSEGRPLEDAECARHERIVEKQCELAACPHWQLGSWSQCSVSCGSDGFQTRLVQCVDSVGRKLPDQHCQQNNGELRPQSHKVCTTGPCPYWRTGEWAQCSVSCGQGVRERSVECVSRDQVADDSLCQESNRPPRQDRCVLLACAFWSPEAWEPCSATCGWGVQKRAVNCMRQSSSTSSQNQANRSMVVHDRECPGQKPRAERSCERLNACPSPNGGGAFWNTGPWMECSAQTCANGGNGTQKRIVECRNTQRLLPSPFCSHMERPLDSRSCECKEPPKGEDMKEQNMTTSASAVVKQPQENKPIGKWAAEEWTMCSLTCGGGWRQRKVHCNANGTLGTCPEADKPINVEQCNTKQCPSGQWHIGAWSSCSITCGKGEQSRQVWCNSAVNLQQKLDEKECLNEEKPTLKRACSRLECPNGVTKTKVIEKATSSAASSASAAPPPPATTTTSSSAAFSSSVSVSVSSSSSSISTESDEPLPQMSATAKMAALASGKPHWEAGPWSACPQHCGPTVRTRHLRCIDPTAGGHEVNQSKCPESIRPAAEHRCRQTNCPRWHKGDWELCSTSCGVGISRREVYCQKGRAPIKIADGECIKMEPKPFETRKCEMARCPNYSWRVGSWSKCADPCKPSEQRRRVFCMSEHGKRAASKMCIIDVNGTALAGAVQPAETRKCPTDKCPYHWVSGPWSTCSRTCGTGFHFRRIECKVRKEIRLKDSITTNNSTNVPGSEPTVLSRMCMALEKPIVTKQCVMNPCNAEFHWNVGPWSQCSKNCGPGFRRRKVRCLDRTQGRVDKEKCDQKNRPKRRESCFVRNCLPGDCAELKAQQLDKNGIGGKMLDGNYTVLVTGFRIEVYCHLMNETIPKTYLNVQPASNLAEYYGKRLVYPYSCPHDGHRNDSCACTNDGHVGQGLSKYRKIRVDLHNMKINPNDQTFAKTEWGSPVAYGTAGDCYSMSDCPQGHFSIDLRGTGLRLVDDLQWTDQGHRTSSRIERSENNALIQGFCGGYCGECAPDRFKGLVLEVDQQQSPIVGVG